MSASSVHSCTEFDDPKDTFLGRRKAHSALWSLQRMRATGGDGFG